MIEIKNLTFKYGKKPVLDDISVTFGEGEFILIAGNNGVGKSTLLRCLMGVLSPLSGEIRFGEGLTRRHIGYLPDDLSFYENMTIEQAVEFHSRIYRPEGTFDDTLVRTVDLEMNRKIKELSRGERALVLFSLIVAQQPRVLLIDEIIHTLDAYVRDIFMDNLLELIARFNTAVIAVNHSFTGIEKIPERLLLMDRGRFTLDAPTDELRQKIRKLELGPGVEFSPEDREQLPVLFQKETEYHKEYYVYPFEEHMEEACPHTFLDVSLEEIVKSFIGGSYVKRRV